MSWTPGGDRFERWIESRLRAELRLTEASRVPVPGAYARPRLGAVRSWTLVRGPLAGLGVAALVVSGTAGFGALQAAQQVAARICQASGLAAPGCGQPMVARRPPTHRVGGGDLPAARGRTPLLGGAKAPLAVGQGVPGISAPVLGVGGLTSLGGPPLAGPPGQGGAGGVPPLGAPSTPAPGHPSPPGPTPRPTPPASPGAMPPSPSPAGSPPPAGSPTPALPTPPAPTPPGSPAPTPAPRPPGSTPTPRPPQPRPSPEPSPSAHHHHPHGGGDCDTDCDHDGDDS